jgi:spoIIIJ-associated protein
MEWVETTGRTIDEAKDAALDQLGVDEADAEFEVLADSKTGLFGRVKVEARVRARVRPTSPRPKDGEGRRRRDRRDRPKSERPEKTERSSKVHDSDADSTSETSGDNVSSGSQRSRRTSQRSRRREKSPATTNEGATNMDEQVALAEQGEVAEEFLQGLFQQLGTSTAIAVDINEEEELVNVDIQGDNLGTLIGPRGSTLHSLQELTRTVVQRKTGARNGRILLDIARYREKRREALARFSHQVADEVLSTGEERALEAMNPSDRKIVHDTINGIDGVETTSEGEEPRRRVVVKPATRAGA